MVIQSLDKTTAGQGSYNVVSSSQGKTAQPEKSVVVEPGTVARPEPAGPIVVEAAKQQQPQGKGDVKNNPVAAEEERKAKIAEIINDDHKMQSITDTLNKFMAQWSADLQFSFHKETGSLMVKFVDIKHNKVLKEFPPEEYLDMVANIRKYIGTMVDEKA